MTCPYCGVWQKPKGLKKRHFGFGRQRSETAKQVLDLVALVSFCVGSKVLGGGGLELYSFVVGAPVDAVRDEGNEEIRQPTTRPLRPSIQGPAR
jgi:hypothetical protein